MRLPELDQEAINVEPVLTDCFSNDLPDIGIGIDKGRVERHMNRDLLEILVFGGDGSERHGDPVDTC